MVGEANDAAAAPSGQTTGGSGGPVLVSPSAASAHTHASADETVVVSGGTGYNDLIGATTGPTTYVMPVSDNGGSSSEIIRALSGPSVGDLRSRLVRLIPTTTSSSASLPSRPRPPASNDALHALLSYRLPVEGTDRDIKVEWLDILEGNHALWRGIEPDRKEVVRGFLVHFQSEILRRAHRNFNLRGLSLGNAFISAAQKFFRSLQSAIFLFSATTLVAGSGATVVPCINTNQTATIAARLQDGTTIVGQCEISHPAESAFAPAGGPGSEALASGYRRLVGNSADGMDPDEREDDGNDGNAAPTASGAGGEPGAGAEQEAGNERPPKRTHATSNLIFSKQSGPNGPKEHDLPSRITSIHYINSHLHPVSPSPAPSFTSALLRAKTLIYSCGSLWTSLAPSLILRGVGPAIANSSTLKHKVLLLNTEWDRETKGYDARDFVQAIWTCLTESNDASAASAGTPYRPQDFITHLVYHPLGQVPIDPQAIQRDLGIQCIALPASESESTAGGRPRFEEADVRWALGQVRGAS